MKSSTSLRMNLSHSQKFNQSMFNAIKTKNYLKFFIFFFVFFPYIFLKVDCFPISLNENEMILDDLPLSLYTSQFSLTESDFTSQSIPVLMLFATWYWWYHQNTLALKSGMKENNLKFFFIFFLVFFFVFFSWCLCKQEMDRMIESRLFSQFTEWKSRWYWMTSLWDYIHLNSVSLSRTLRHSRFQYWCFLQRDTDGIIRIHLH